MGCHRVLVGKTWRLLNSALCTRKAKAVKRVNRIDKPTIFFSHSSADKKVLTKLRESFIEKTGSAIDVFMSSDGQSIPFGRNWVHEVEAALDSAQLMVVFISPQSLNSHWLFFEAGFAHCKNIQVVPVAILGVDLNNVPPPLGLLQGFNLTTAGGLNNLIAQVNKLFEHSHKESFTEPDYTEIFASDPLHGSGLLREYTTLVDNIEFNFKPDLIEYPLNLIRKALMDANLDYQETDFRLNTYGMQFEVYDRPKRSLSSISLSPSLLNVNFPILENLFSHWPRDIEDCYFVIVFQRSIHTIQELHKLTARFYRSGITLSKENTLTYMGIEFVVWSIPVPVKLRINYADKKLTELPLYELIQCLFDCEALTLKSD